MFLIFASFTYIVTVIGRIRIIARRTSHLFDAYDAFSSFCFSFSFVLSLMTMDLINHMDMDQGPGSLLVCTFCYGLNFLMIESFDRLVESFLIESQYSQHFRARYFPAQIFL